MTNKNLSPTGILNSLIYSLLTASLYMAQISCGKTISNESLYSDVENQILNSRMKLIFYSAYMPVIDDIVTKTPLYLYKLITRKSLIKS